MRALIMAAVTVAACAMLVGCGAPPDAGENVDQSDEALRHRPPSSSSGGTTSAPTSLPNAALTPGAVLTSDVNTICKTGYSSTVRNVTGAEKQQAAAEYHYTGPSSGVEYDHLISLELGGGNDLKNLWPQPIAEAHVKDRLENYLHAAVCSGKMQLPDVQARVAANWIQLWNDVGRP